MRRHWTSLRLGGMSATGSSMFLFAIKVVVFMNVFTISLL